MLSKFLSDVGNDDYVLGGKKALEDVRNFQQEEKKVKEAAASDYWTSMTALPADQFVESESKRNCC